MNIDKKAKELRAKYGIITQEQLAIEVPNEKQRRKVFSRLVYLAHSQGFG